MKMSFLSTYAPVLLAVLLAVLIGAALGAALGYFGQCTSGTCPLTSTWWRGALYGSVLGLFFGLTSSARSAPIEKQETPSALARMSPRPGTHQDAEPKDSPRPQ